jgi:ABC-type transport system involved in multi-copper enzyme maturation permease subunit
MGSSDLTSQSRMPMTPFLAILRHDLRTLWSSWLVRLWLAGTAVLTLLIVASGWAKLQTAPLAGVLFFQYLFFPWVLVVMVLGVMPVTGARAEALADGFLSRPVTRYEYLLAAWSARVLTVLGVYLAVMVPAILVLCLANRPAPEDTVTLAGVISALAVVGLVQVFLTSLGFLLGTLMQKPLLPLLILVFFWFPINVIMNAFSLEELSPLSLNRSMATLLRKPWPGAAEDPAAAAEEGQTEQPDSWTGHFLKVLSEEPKPEPTKSPFFDSKDFGDFSLTRVVLGYGLPTLAAVVLATACFCYRDF